MKNSTFEKFVKVLIGLSFFVPLIVLPNQFIFPFIVPKIVLFRIITMLMLAGYLVLLLGDSEKYKLKATPLNIVIGLFFLSFAISTFVGVDWYRSFWDNHERMLGLFTFFHYILYYYILTTVIRSKEEWKVFLRWFLSAGMLVMIIALWQRFVDPEALLNRNANRVSATLGNPIYLSGYGLFMFAVGSLLAFQEKIRTTWWYFALIGLFLGFFGIFLGGTRGTLIGLLLGIGVLFLSYFFLVKSEKIKRIFGIFILLALIIGGSLFAFRQTDFVKGIPTVGRLVNISLTSGTAETRIMAWGIAVESWQEKPIFGWGPNNYYYAFNKFYRPEFLEHGFGETWFDNAHNIVMNTLSVQGSVGLLLYFGIFAIAFYAVLRGYKDGKISEHTTAISFAFLVAHFIHNVFVFENPTSYLYFFFFLAFINHLSLFPGKEKETNKNVSTITKTMIFLVFLLVIFITNINPARANMAMLDTIYAIYHGQKDSIELYSKATSIPSPHVDDIRNDFARSVLQVMNQYIQKGLNEQASKLYDLAQAELQKNRILHPDDIRAHIQQAELALGAAQYLQKIEFVSFAETALDDALVKSPKRQQIHYMLAGVKAQLGKIDQSVKILQTSVDQDPKIIEGWWRLALMYYSGGKPEIANQIISKAENEHGIVWDARAEEALQVIRTAVNSTVTSS